MTIHICTVFPVPKELGSGGAGRMLFEERRLHKVVSSGASATSWALFGHCIKYVLYGFSFLPLQYSLTALGAPRNVI